jgi:hypothetical protein
MRTVARQKVQDEGRALVTAIENIQSASAARGEAIRREQLRTEQRKKHLVEDLENERKRV